MSTVKKIAPLESGQKHLLKLIDRQSKTNGWAQASEVIFNHLAGYMPHELIELDHHTKRVRLTQDGQEVVRSMSWLEGAI